jgi:hypothetical protein
MGTSSYSKIDAVAWVIGYLGGKIERTSSCKWPTTPALLSADDGARPPTYMDHTTPPRAHVLLALRARPNSGRERREANFLTIPKSDARFAFERSKSQPL